MWTTKRQHEFQGHPDMQQRMHNDLLALEGLSRELPAITGARMIVEKGYAIDAACSGRLTRFHYDTDVLLATPQNDDPEKLYGVIREVLGRSTGFAWRSTQQIRKSWVKFHELGKREWDDGVTGTERDNELALQMDMHIVNAAEPFVSDEYIELTSGPRTTYPKPIENVSLHSSGVHFGLTVPTVSDMAATKLRLIRSFDMFYGNGLRASDYYDFGQLFNSPKFNPEDFYDLITDYYANKHIAVSEIPGLIQREIDPLRKVVPASLLGFLACKVSTVCR
jgi:hypothetical protein